MTQVVRVLLDGASGLEFDYSIPDKIKNKVVVGSRIRVPLRNRASTGTVVAFISSDELGVAGSKIKPISDLISEKPVSYTHLTLPTIYSV